MMGLFDSLKSVLAESRTLDLPFAILDCETTGLDSKKNRILELSIINWSPTSGTKSEWVQRFNPQGPVGATEIHGITDADVADMPIFTELVPDIVKNLQGKVLVAHNARFDLAFLRYELDRSGWKMPYINGFCTFQESKYFLPNLERRRLSDCCDAIGVNLEDAHSALGDARATRDLLAHYLDMSHKPVLNSSQISLMKEDVSRQWPTKATMAPKAFKFVSGPATQSSTSGDFNKFIREVLANLNLERILRGLPELGATEYIEKVLQSLEDGLIDSSEQKMIDAVAGTLELSSEVTSNLNRSILREACVEVWRDGSISALERDHLSRLAEVLNVEAKVLTKSLKEAESIRYTEANVEINEIPADWELGEPLRLGDRVCFTGGDPVMRYKLETKSVSQGLRVSSTISSKTSLLVADGDFSGNKLRDAQEKGIRIVTYSDYAKMVEFVQISKKASA
jgi:DNA polymerase-3 subunit epsilon